MRFENGIVLDKTNPTSLAILKNKNCKALRIDVSGRTTAELPGELGSMTLIFFDAVGVPLKRVGFTRPDSFPIILAPDEDFVINTDFCSIESCNAPLLDKEVVRLSFHPSVQI